MAQPRLAEFVRQSLLVLAGMVAGFFVAEAALRWAWPGGYANSRSIYRPDPILGYALRPESSAAGVQIGPDGRRVEAAPVPPEVRFTTVLLGDSFVFGGVSAMETLAALTQRILMLRCPECGHRVIGMGANGYNTEQEVLWYEQNPVAAAQLVIAVVFPANDLWPNWNGGRLALRFGRLPGPGDPVPWGELGALFEAPGGALREFDEHLEAALGCETTAPALDAALAWRSGQSSAATLGAAWQKIAANSCYLPVPEELRATGLYPALPHAARWTAAAKDLPTRTGAPEFSAAAAEIIVGAYFAPLGAAIEALHARHLARSDHPVLAYFHRQLDEVRDVPAEAARAAFAPPVEATVKWLRRLQAFGAPATPSPRAFATMAALMPEELAINEPLGAAINDERAALYRHAAAMQAVMLRQAAEAAGIPTIDLYAPLRARAGESPGVFARYDIQLNVYGNFLAAQELARVILAASAARPGGAGP